MITIFLESDKFSHIAGVTLHATNILARKSLDLTTDMIIRTFTWYQKSTICYVVIKKLLCLPSVRLLRDVASNFNVGCSNSSYNYLSNKVQYLKPSELLVIIQLHEIHIKPKFTYKCGKLIGNAGNNAGNNAQHQTNRIQCFMISSVLSSNIDVVSLVPVQKMTIHDFTVMTQKVIQNITRAGYRIVSVISDNNVLNRKMVMELSGTGQTIQSMSRACQIVFPDDRYNHLDVPGTPAIV